MSTRKSTPKKGYIVINHVDDDIQVYDDLEGVQECIAGLMKMHDLDGDEVADNFVVYEVNRRVHFTVHEERTIDIKFHNP